MAGSVNKVFLVGRLGKAPEVRNFQNGGKVVNFTLATSETWNDRASGERKEKTDWHNIVIKNEKIGEIAEKYLKKGSSIYIKGKIETRKWTDQSGQDKYTTEVIVGAFRGELTLLGSRDNNVHRGRQRGPRQLPVARAQPSTGQVQQQRQAVLGHRKVRRRFGRRDSILGLLHFRPALPNRTDGTGPPPAGAALPSTSSPWSTIMDDLTRDPPFPDACRTGRAFISPCCTSSSREFLVDGVLYLACRVAGHGWFPPRRGRIEDINDTGTLVDADGTERHIRWQPDRDPPFLSVAEDGA